MSRFFVDPSAVDGKYIYMTDKSDLHHMKKVLPVYMIPSRLTELKNIPMTATNKIDLQQLKAMAAHSTSVLIQGHIRNLHRQRLYDAYLPYPILYMIQPRQARGFTMILPEIHAAASKSRA